MFTALVAVNKAFQARPDPRAAPLFAAKVFATMLCARLALLSQAERCISDVGLMHIKAGFGWQAQTQGQI